MSEKIILAVVHHSETDNVITALVDNEIDVTQLSSMGGFLRRGNTTLLIGVDQSELENVLAVIRGAPQGTLPEGEHAVTLFVLDAESFEQI
ncbi:MAG: cyclic-di-AMP receptor [Anaerolineae bacterium]|nr:cyclic-di-AMP receptor [Anaerolineae bacterium]